MPYLTPFVGMFIKLDCYLKLLNDFRNIINSPLTFKPESHHPEVNEARARHNYSYPIGCMGDDMEIHFLH